MYTPNHFKSPDRASDLQLIRDYPLATLVAQGEAGLDANLIPLYWYDDGSEFGVLRGHLARANRLALCAGREILALFQSRGDYISPNYYPSKARDPRVVPTWNYSAVQINGVLEVMDSPEALRQLLSQMTEHHEQGQAQPWAMSDAPSDYLEKMLAAVVGIEIRIQSMQGKFKQSQNQSAENQAGVRAALA
ncbi:FMN-binding negative transcriptional regulator [Chitinibacter sp. SCUT-21]|uniref:FMN-binding negative transcriptional regulator n=1 Tax=Chitinibacter sp. SCUT-21 TaxID=2970891 RepID=UPI0035A6C4E8